MPQPSSPHDGTEGAETTALLAIKAALRSLLREDREERAVEVLERTVEHLGGITVPAGIDDERIIPIDVSMGIGEPRHVAAPLPSVARTLLERFLPELVEDVRVVLDRLRRDDERAEEAGTDPLTGLLNRRALGRVLGRAHTGHTLVVVDLDHYDSVAERHGPDLGEAALRAFAGAVRRTVRATDLCARTDGGRFVIVFADQSPDQAGIALRRLREAWELIRPVRVTFSAGVARLAPGESPTATLRLAEGALDRAQRGGRDRVELAG